MKKFIHSLFGFSGRMNRKKYIIRVAFLHIFWTLVFLTFILAFFPFMFSYWLTGDASVIYNATPLSPLKQTLIRPVHALTFMMGIICFVVMISLDVRRLHDMNLSGWWILVAIVGMLVISFFVAQLSTPLYLLWNAFLFLKPGTFGPNKYGDDPLAQVLPAPDSLQ